MSQRKNDDIFYPPYTIPNDHEEYGKETKERKGKRWGTRCWKGKKRLQQRQQLWGKTEAHTPLCLPFSTAFRRFPLLLSLPRAFSFCFLLLRLKRNHEKKHSFFLRLLFFFFCAVFPSCSVSLARSFIFFFVFTVLFFHFLIQFFFRFLSSFSRKRTSFFLSLVFRVHDEERGQREDTQGTNTASNRRGQRPSFLFFKRFP